MERRSRFVVEDEPLPWACAWQQKSSSNSPSRSAGRSPALAVAIAAPVLLVAGLVGLEEGLRSSSEHPGFKRQCTRSRRTLSFYRRRTRARRRRSTSFPRLATLAPAVVKKAAVTSPADDARLSATETPVAREVAKWHFIQLSWCLCCTSWFFGIPSCRLSLSGGTRTALEFSLMQ